MRSERGPGDVEGVSMDEVENDLRPEWISHLERKHGKPIDQIDGTLYGLCYATPLHVWSVSIDYSGTDRGRMTWGPNGHAASLCLIQHYVGWTQQRDPYGRINNHHPPGTSVTVTLGRGTMRREEEIKRTARCPTCGAAYADDLL